VFDRPSPIRTVAVPAAIQALFLDRDGTLIEDRHFVGAVDQVTLIPGTREALARLLATGTRLFILTNQSGVNRGYFTLADVDAVNRRMIDLLDLGPEPFTRICIAPWRPVCRWRRSRPPPRRPSGTPGGASSGSAAIRACSSGSTTPPDDAAGLPVCKRTLVSGTTVRIAHAMAASSGLRSARGCPSGSVTA
jgi:HAD superfamily hydrolase (TIGR01662 family)